MERIIKFRAWYNNKMYEVYAIHLSSNSVTIGLPRFPFCQDVTPDAIMQFTGLTDKNGKEIYYSGDLLKIKVIMGDNKEYISEGIYKTNDISFEGLSLSFVKLINNDPKNQYPIIQSPSFRYGTLCVDFVNKKYDCLALDDNWGENHMNGMRWQENHYSNDIEVIGHENENLLKS